MLEHYTLDRDKLYEEVWAEPMTKVSKRYGISDVALAKICRKMAVPVPERGYWARLTHGRKQTPLPNKPKDVPQQTEVHPTEPAPWKPSIETASADQIRVADTLTDPHRLTLKLQKSLTRSAPDSYGRVNSTRNDIDVHVGPNSVSVYCALWTPSSRPPRAVDSRLHLPNARVTELSPW